MTNERQELINYAQGEKYKSICLRLTKDQELAKDLHQEFLLILLEYDESKISGIRQKDAFLYRVLTNMACSKTSTFYREYRRTITQDVAFKIRTASMGGADPRLGNLDYALDDLYWYDRELIRMYAEEGAAIGSVIKVARKLNIPYKSIQTNIKKSKDRIKKAMEKFPIKVLIPVQYNITGLDYHRLLMPFERLQKTHGSIYDIKMLRGFKHEDKAYEPPIYDMTDDELKQFDIVYILRQVSHDITKIQPTIDRIKSLGLKIIFDIDDYWQLPKTHFWHTKYKEQKVADGVIATLKQADAVTTTTGTFADIIKEYNQNVTVLPNCINSDEPQFKAVNISSPRLRFGWIGGVFHKTDLEILKPSIEKLYAASNLSGKWQLCLGGFNKNYEFLEMERILSCNYIFKTYDKPYYSYLEQLTPAMEHIAFDKPYRRLWGKDVKHYGQIYNDVDVCLVPLVKNAFNECKSELKLVEAGTMGKCVICSDVKPYNEWIVDGVNGFLIKPERNYIDWFVAMRKLILNPELAKQMGEALQKTISENFNIDTHNKRRDALIKSVVL